MEKKTLLENKLREKREQLRLTQRQVAEEVGITYQAYQRYEIGQIVPNVNIALQIAKTLGTTVEELYS